MREIVFIILWLPVSFFTFGQADVKVDAQINANIQALLSEMTLEEKIGQMTQAERGSLAGSGYNDIQQFYLGSVLSGGGSVPSPNTAEAWVEMYNQMQEKAMATPQAIPIIYGVDAVHGHNNLKNAVIFPHNIGLGCTRNPELVELCARITALEVTATGLDWTFSPCVAVPQNEFWGRTYEGFSESPYLTDSLGLAAVKGYQGDTLGTPNALLACAKHFLGDGGTLNGHDQGNAVMTEDELREIHLPPYESAIDAGVGSVMISFSSWNGVKCHGNPYLINDVLKDELGFEGLVVSDWKGIDQLNGDFKEAVKTAINAGVDMAMQPDNYIPFINNLIELVNEGEVSMERIDDAVARILEIKFKLGLFDNPFADLSLLDTIGCSYHREIARQAVRESLVLLKNDNILPLPKNNSTVLVAGPKGNDVGAMCGGWTISWQGSLGNITEGTTVYEGIKDAIGSENVVYTNNPTQIPSADYAVVVVGENPYAEGAGDLFGNVAGFGLSAQDKQMIQAVENSNIPMVIVLLSGRPLDISDELQGSGAFIAAWLPGTEGGTGIADVLFGDHLPSGRLSYTWPETYSDVPINIIGNYPGNEALFPYGFGLTFNTGIDEDHFLSKNIKIYPNPAGDFVIIEAESSMEIISIRILDPVGKVVAEKKNPVLNKTSFPLDGFSTGIYCVEILTEEGGLMKKIIKQ